MVKTPEDHVPKFYAQGSILIFATLIFQVLFQLKFATEFFSLKTEQWLRRPTLSLKFVDQKFQETWKFHINFKKRLNPVRMANTRRCAGPLRIHTLSKNLLKVKRHIPSKANEKNRLVYYILKVWIFFWSYFFLNGLSFPRGKSAVNTSAGHFLPCTIANNAYK